MSDRDLPNPLDSKTYIQDCMPAMADVVSGAIPEPRERAEGEKWQTWLKSTPAFRKLGLHIGNLKLDKDADLADFLGDPGALCVNEINESNLIWRVICFNADGTRAAIREFAGQKYPNPKYDKRTFKK